MAINFPSSPQLNDTVTVGSTRYKWDGTKWVSTNLDTFVPQASIGVTVQGYDADTAKTDVTQSFTAAQRGAISALGNSSGTITLDMATANNFSLTLNANSTNTLANPSNVSAGQSGVIVITQDVTGGRTLAYGTSWKFAAGTAPVLSTAANAVDVLSYYVISATQIIGTLAKDVK